MKVTGYRVRALTERSKVYRCSGFRARENGRLDLRNAERSTASDWTAVGYVTLVNVPVEITRIEWEQA